MAEQAQPGAADNAPPQPSSDDKETQLEAMTKLLAAKDAEIAALKLEDMKKQLAAKDAEIAALKDKDAKGDNSTADGSGGGDEDADEEEKAPPKCDVTLQLRGIPEYDAYPFAQAADKFYFMASIKAPYFRASDRAPIDLVAVVDESGSMSGDRIKLVKETVQFIIKNLESGDRFGIVGYSSGAREVLPLTKMDESGKKKASELGKKLRASGGTALCAGLVVGVNMMRNRTFKNDVASVMILTDGQANQGPTSAPDIIKSVLAGAVKSKFGGGGGYGGYGGPPAPQIYNNYNAPMQMNQMNRNVMQQQYVPQQQQMMQQMQQQQPQYQQAPVQRAQGQPPPMKIEKQIQGMSLQSQGQPQQTKPTPPGPPKTKPQPPAPQSQSVSDDTADEKEQKEGQSQSEIKELPCTINTFGFGTGHNADLLQAISERGRGMYAFIETTDTIADTFAECLGGLVSMIGQDLLVKVEALNSVEITKCLSKGLPHSVTRPRKVHTVKIKDLQSEESRDLVFELKVPAIGSAKASDPIIQLSVAYKNVVKDKKETLSTVCTVDRIEGAQKGERNMELDVQYNRVMAADAMERADALANAGRMADARKMLNAERTRIQASPSNMESFSVNLMSDMQRIESNMQSTNQYASHGRKMMRSQHQAQQMQRSAQSSQWASQGAYENRSKKAMKKRFKK